MFAGEVAGEDLVGAFIIECARPLEQTNGTRISASRRHIGTRICSGR